MTELILKELRIYRRESYLDKTESLFGTIVFKNAYGQTSLNLNEELSRRVVELCAEEIASSAADLAENIKADALAVNAPALDKLEGRG